MIELLLPFPKGSEALYASLKSLSGLEMASYYTIFFLAVVVHLFYGRGLRREKREIHSGTEPYDARVSRTVSLRRMYVLTPIRPDERSTELQPYSTGLCTSLFSGGWPPILDFQIFQWIPGSIWFSLKVILFLFLYIWVRAAFPRYRYDQLMGLGRKVFLPLSLARVVPVSGVSVTFRWLP